MDTEMRKAKELFDHLAAVNEHLIALYFALRNREETRDVTRGFDVRKCEDGGIIEAFVEVETKKDLAYCWWLELRIGTRDWRIETSIHKTHKGGQDVIHRFPDRVPETFSDFLVEFNHAAKQLIDSAREFKLNQ